MSGMCRGPTVSPRWFVPPDKIKLAWISGFAVRLQSAFPEEIGGHTRQDDDQSGPGRVGLVKEEDHENGCGGQDIKNRHERIPDCTVWTVDVRTLAAQDGYTGDGQYIETQRS